MRWKAGDMMIKDTEFTPREIEIFAAVMLHGTTTKAADALDLTQPAISKALHQFSAKAGFQVFRKHRQRLIATPEAQMLYAEVQRVFESSRVISRTAREIRELRGVRLNICALPAFGLTLLPSIVSSFSKQHPEVSISIDIRSTATMLQRAGRNQLDVGIGVTSSEELPAISRRALISTPPVCVMPAGHPLASREVIAPEDLHGLDFVSMGRGDIMRQQLDALCDERGVERNKRVEVAQSNACISLVAAGAGVALVDSLSVWMARNLPIEFRPFRPELDLQLSVYRPWGVIASSAAEAFTEHLIQAARASISEMNERLMVP
jgi:DNA-binding transcriptional LysR family regulator